MSATELPIFDCKDALLSKLKSQQQVILQAPPGAGKTSCVPLWLLDRLQPGEKLILLQPRRLACLASAKHLSRQLGQEVGERIGYRVRFEQKISANTQIEVMTLGVFLQIIQKQPELDSVTHIIFDEFHERSIDNDIAFALAHACKTYYREDLHLLIMSATLDTHLLQRKLGWPMIKSEGRQYPVEQHFKPIDDFAKQVAYIQGRLQLAKGHILVFLPGKKEIQQLHEALPASLCLHGSLTLEQQQQVFNLSTTPQIILTTNIAESSVTINGVREVIDFGKERFLQINKKGQSILNTRHISQASAKQRMGRAGRQGSGYYTALWAKEQPLPPQHNSAISEQDFCIHLLRILLWGVTLDELCLIEQPKQSELARCQQLLRQLGCLGENLQVNATFSQRLLSFACPLPIARLLSLASHNSKGDLIELASFLEQQQQTQNSLALDLRKWSHQNRSLPKQHPIKKQQQRWQKQLNGNLLSETTLDLVDALIQSYFNQIAYLKNNQYIGVLGQQFVMNETSHKWILVLNSFCSGKQHIITSWIALGEQQIKPYIQQRAYLSSDGLNAYTQKVLGKIIISQQPCQLTKQQRQKAILNCIEQQGLISLLHKQADQQQFICRLQWATQLDERFLAFSIERLEQDLTWLEPYIGQIKQPDQLNLQQILTDEMGFDRTKRLNQLLPTHFVLPSGDRCRLHYQQDKILLKAKIQGLFGLQHTPSIGNGQIKLLIELLSPAGKTVQTTQDLSSFWQSGYFEVKKQLKGRYPKHPWPDDPRNAIATLKSKKQFEAQNGKPTK